MPWMQSGPMDERVRFVTAYHEGLWSMAELCRAFDVSRRTGYKLLHRFQAEGLDGLKDRSRAPKRSPQRIPAAVQQLLLEARHAHPYWGPRKILPWLLHRNPELAGQLPAASTVGDLYRRHGLLLPRRRRRKVAESIAAGPLQTSTANEVWTADYKGEFRLGNQQYCYPFTLVDAHSRYLLTCSAESSITVQATQQALLRAFQTFGLPGAIRTDNGMPFVGIGRTGLTRLSVWWIQLGIRHQRIPKRRPDQNGRHERMHRTLKQETTRPPEKTIASQQRRFDAFRQEYNLERPHEALANQTPMSHYQNSFRLYPGRIEPPDYPGHYETRKVDSSGMIRFRGQALFLATPLAGHTLGIVEINNDVWSLQYYDRELGRLTSRCSLIELKVLPMSSV